MTIIFLLIAAALPVLIALFFFFYKIDSHDKEPIFNVGIAFLFGCIAAFMGLWLEEKTLINFISQDLYDSFFEAFIGVSLIEEFLKFIPAVLIVFYWRVVDEFIDSILYSVFIALGFAFVENLLYSLSSGMTTTIVRAFTAIPIHIISGVFIGYFLASAKVVVDKKTKINLILFAFLSAFVFHGLYDFFIIQNVSETLIGGALIVLAAGVYLAILLIKKARSVGPI